MAQTTTRKHNQRQELYCEFCKRLTVHESNDPNQVSEWVVIAGSIRAYRQFRACIECNGSGPPEAPLNYGWTVEMNEDDFNRVYNELKSLREFRDSISVALETVRDPAMP